MSDTEHSRTPSQGQPAHAPGEASGATGATDATGTTGTTDADADATDAAGAAGAATLHRWDDIPREAVTSMIGRKLVTGERMMLAQVYLDEGCVVPKHSHENEQLTWIVEGALRFRLGEEGQHEVVVRAGEVLHIPSNLPHEAKALEDTVDVDIFAPPRSDWLDGTDSYFHEPQE